jgi:hypothetical protein
VLAAGLTCWVLFALWLAGPSLGVPAGVQRTAAGFVAVELLAMLTWSYGCDDGECGALGVAAGAAARTDVPVLAAVFLAVVATTSWRRNLAR